MDSRQFNPNPNPNPNSNPNPNPNPIQGSAVDEVDAHGRTALMTAAECGQSAIVRVLLAHGADVAHTDKDGGTALLRACEAGETGTVRVRVRVRASRR